MRLPIYQTHTHTVRKWTFWRYLQKKNQIAALIPARNAQNGKKLPRKDFVFGWVLALILILNPSKRILSTVVTCLKIVLLVVTLFRVLINKNA